LSVIFRSRLVLVLRETKGEGWWEYVGKERKRSAGHISTFVKASIFSSVPTHGKEADLDSQPSNAFSSLSQRFRDNQ
jgi:hypothetical protein